MDTNVVVSSFFGGKPKEIVDRWQEGQFVLCVTDEIVREYTEVLARFAGMTEAASGFFARLSRREHVLWVDPAKSLHPVSADPSDDKFLECALAAEADLIVSGDRHLLALGEFRGVPILDPAQALPLLAEGENPSPVE